MESHARIPSQIQLPLSVAFGVVRQGIRIRLGRSLVTLSGVVLGITFLMSTLTAQALKRGVADEDRLRQEVSRMYGYLAAESGPLYKKPVALVQTGPLSAAERRLLQRLAEEGASELRHWAGAVATNLPKLEIPIVTATSMAALTAGVPATVVLGSGPLPRLDWQTLVEQARQPVVAFSRQRSQWKMDGITSLNISRPLEKAEQQRLAKEQRKSRFRGMWIIAISLLVTVIGISNAMLMSVTERFRDIGTMKCLGALSSFIRTIFLIEAALMGAVGGAMGAVFGFAFAAISYFLPYGPVLAAKALTQQPGFLVLAALLSLCAGILLSIIAALYPARLAAKMVPADALRSNV